MMSAPDSLKRSPTLRSLLFALSFYAVTAVFLVFGSPLLFGPRKWAMAGLKAHAIVCVWLLRVVGGIGLEVRGLDKLSAAPALIVSKHQSAWDTFALIPLFHDPAIVLKDELRHIPFYGWFCVKFEHILVKRGRAAVALKAMIADARERASAGRQIVIFPEGTRRAPGATPDYKPGHVALYEGLGLPCYPVALNSGIYWPRQSLIRPPGRIVVEILDPLPPGLPRSEYRQRVESAIEEASQRLLVEAERGAPTQEAEKTA